MRRVAADHRGERRREVERAARIEPALSTEAVVRRAVELEQSGRHLLLAGDPVAAGEAVAAPSAAALEGIACCLLDLSPQAQAQRLERRGDPPALTSRHQAFAD
jgi:hypothetical protein